jgi:hypothetical protein
MNRYKYIDVLLIAVAIMFLIKLIFQYLLLNNGLTIIVKTTLGAFILCLFLYEKTKNFKLQLNPKMQNIVLRLEFVFDPFFKFTSSIIKPCKIGQGVMIDLSQLAIITIILTILIFF